MTNPLKALFDSMGLRSHPKLRLFLKRAYCRLIDPLDRGSRLPLNAGAVLRVPTYLATAAYADYEEVAVQACRLWLESNPGAVVADVGCGLGIYSALALHASRGTCVFAFDSDRFSLEATGELCRFYDSSRLGLIHGFLTENHASGMTLGEALAATRRLLSASDHRVEPTAARYLCLDRPLPDEFIPRHSLDGLLLGEIPVGSAALFKIDVEGAELIVLRGATELMRRNRPTILLSVHPQFLPSFQQSTADVTAFLRGHRYAWTVLATDHEEHWWCVPDEGGHRDGS
jgi:FkbM family methyltransferase